MRFQNLLILQSLVVFKTDEVQNLEAVLSAFDNNKYSFMVSNPNYIYLITSNLHPMW